MTVKDKANELRHLWALRWIGIANVALSILSIGVLWRMYHFLVPWLTRKQRDKLVSMMGEKDQNEPPTDGTLPECG